VSSERSILGGLRRASLAIGLVVLGLDLPLLMLTWYLYHRTQTFRERAVTTQGMIVDLEARSGTEGGTTYAPVYRFTDEQGAEHTVTSRLATNPNPYEVGDTVSVLYPPEEPSKARLDRFGEMWLWATIVGVIAAIPLGLVVVLVVVVPLILRVAGRGDQRAQEPGRMPPPG